MHDVRSKCTRSGVSWEVFHKNYLVCIVKHLQNSITFVKEVCPIFNLPTVYPTLNFTHTS